MKYWNDNFGDSPRAEDIGCGKAQSLMSAFIDSMARNDEAAQLEAHLATCVSCQRQLQACKSVRNLLRSVEPPPVPADLVLETRVRLSHERVPAGLARIRERLEVWAANTIRPLAVPAVAGVVSTVLLFGFMLQNMEAYESSRIELSPYTYTRLERPPADLTQPLFVEIYVDKNGKVPYYIVLSGPDDSPVVDTWLDDLLFTAVFKPATAGGQPIHSKLILSLAGVSIGVDES